MDLMLAWNQATQQGDLVLFQGDLQMDGSLASAVVISLASDGLAYADDAVPVGADGVPERRGWWGDMPLDPLAAGGTADHIGSRLWLLRRAKALPAVRQVAEGMVRDALQWLLDDGVASKIDVASVLVNGNTLELAIAIYRNSGAAQSQPAYAGLWRVSLGT